MIDIAAQMAAQTQRIARRDVVELGKVVLTQDEQARLAEALRHIDQAAGDLERLRRGEVVAQTDGQDSQEGSPGI